MLSVSLVRCKNEAVKYCTSKASLSASKGWTYRQVTRFTILIFPIDYCVRIKWWARPFIQWWYSVIDFLIVTASISKLLHSWLFIDPSEHHYTTQTSKFNNFFFYIDPPQWLTLSLSVKDMLFWYSRFSIFGFRWTGHLLFSQYKWKAYSRRGGGHSPHAPVSKRHRKSVFFSLQKYGAASSTFFFSFPSLTLGVGPRNTILEALIQKAISGYHSQSAS